MSNSVHLLEYKAITLILVYVVLLTQCLIVIHDAMTTKMQSNWAVSQNLLELLQGTVHILYHNRIIRFLKASYYTLELFVVVKQIHFNRFSPSISFLHSYKRRGKCKHY